MTKFGLGRYVARNELTSVKKEKNNLQLNNIIKTKQQRNNVTRFLYKRWK